MTTQELQSKLEAAEADVKALEKEYADLGKEAQAIEARLKAIFERRQKLWQTGYMSGSGLIHGAKSSVETAKRELADSLKPRFTVQLSYGAPLEIVVARVTDKRIYVRSAGSDQEQIISIDGKKFPWNWKYDHAELLKFAGV